MEHIADFFKKSGHEENDFPVDEAAWSRLEVELDQKKRKRWLPFWWGSMGLVLLMVGTIYYWSRLTSYPSISGQNITTTAAATETPLTSVAKAKAKISNAAVKEASSINTAEIVATDKILKEASVPVNKAEALGVTVRSAQNQESQMNRITTSARVEKTTNEPTPSISKILVDQVPALPLQVQALTLPAEKIEKKALSTKIVEPVSPSQKNATRYKPAVSKAERSSAGGKSIGMMREQSGIFGAKILGEGINARDKEGSSGRWQLSVGMANMPSRYTGILTYWTTDIQNASNQNSTATPYTFSNGNTIEVYYVDGVNSKVNDNLSFYRLSLLGNLGNGLSLKGSLLLGAIFNRTPNSLIRQVPDRPDIVYFTSSSRSFNWMGEVGLYYTFYRRQRFQPYIGLNMFQLLTSSFRNERRIVAPGLNINEQSNLVTSVGGYSSLPGYYVELGGQYLFTPKWSVGPSLIYVGTSLTQSQIGFGLEARYRW